MWAKPGRTRASEDEPLEKENVTLEEENAREQATEVGVTVVEQEADSDEGQLQQVLD